TRNDRKSSGTNTNWEGHLYLEANYDEKAKAGQNLAVDSVGVSNGGADFINKDAKKKVTINKDVAVSSANLYQETPTLEFKKDLAISGTGGFSSRHYDDFAIPAYRKKVTIGGDFSQETDQTEAPAEGWEHHPEGATYLSPKTDKTVTGSFTVSGKGTAERFGSAASTNLDVKGNFDFGLTAEDYVLNATLTFSGKEPQSVKTAATDLGSVDVKNAAGIVLESDVMQGKSSDLILTQGNISTAEKEDGSHYKWIVKNPGVEENLVGRPQVSLVEETAGNNPATIYRGSRQSFFLAPLVRHIAADGIDDEGKENGGYVFPTGALEEDSRFFRPLILQLAADLPEAVPATVYSESVPEDKTPAWPSENLLVPAGGGEFLTLNTYADIFWKVDFGASELAQNPNIRVAVEGIPNVYEPMGLRIVQWDCDWTNARLAGTYDFVESGDDDTEQSFVKNGWVAGVLNLTQRGVDLGGCSILGVASNGLENPIDQDAITSGVARIQFIHNLPILDPVDLYLDENVRIGNNLSFRSATGYGRFGAGAHELKVQPVGAPPESAIKQPLGSFANDSYYAVIVHGTLADPRIQVVRTKTESTTLVANEVSVLLVHGSAGLGAADIHVLDALDSNRPKSTLVRGFEFDTVTPRYRNLEPGYTNIQVKAGDAEEVYELDLNGYAGEIVILNLSGLGASDLEIYGVDENGGTVLSQVITNVEALEEIPTEFALHGNYPNPFNPSTRIQFDLPESAQVTVQIVDMLGREVMALPAKEFEAGANRSVELNAINLASGTYLYRMIATGAENRYVKTGRMTLVK
ncbi:MAG: DUF4397 domain-containing protein, partial [Bacteroidetes bacterium]|nr:DUF4397 domain-containing protein [Bacteroidota bacterium]